MGANPSSLIIVFKGLTRAHLEWGSQFYDESAQCSSKTMDQVQNKTLCIILGYSKAFDKVDHGILLAKHDALGFSEDLIFWIKSYLQDKMLAVRIGYDFSDTFTATSGVSQGSNLGPLFFLLFINDINTLFSFNSFLLFADDLEIFKAVCNEQDCKDLQSDLKQLQKWTIKNNFFLNIKKCHVISYSRSNKVLTFNYNIGNENIPEYWVF